MCIEVNKTRNSHEKKNARNNPYVDYLLIVSFDF